MDRPITVLVLAVGGNVGQGILKSLDYDQRPLRVLGADIAPLQMGLYTVDQAFVSPWAYEEAFLPWLIDVCAQEHVDVVLSGAEPVLLAMARHQQELLEATGAQCLCSPLPILEICDDKLMTCDWLDREGLPQPAYADMADPDAVHRLVAQVGFPLVAKPRRGGGARGLFHVHDSHDLDYIMGKSDYVIQESVGTDETEYTVGCMRGKDGTLAESCCMRRDLLSGTTFRAEVGAFDEVRQVAEAITVALKPVGPCNVQLRLTERGPVCFEINARFSGTTPIRTHLGYREVSAALDHFLDGTPITLPRITQGVALRYWNELYPAAEAVTELERNSRLTHDAHPAPKIECYGIDD